MTDTIYNALFICTGNSARSILAEGMLNELGKGRFHAYSAGSHPKGEVHPLALATLERLHLPTTGYRSKSWDEFVAPGAPVFDFIFTVCDNAAGEACCRFQKTAALNVRSRLHYSSGGVGSIRQRRAAAGHQRTQGGLSATGRSMRHRWPSRRGSESARIDLRCPTSH